MNLGFDPHQLTPLCHIMYKYGSDKGNIDNLRHNYTTFYYNLFKNLSNNNLRIFELGLGTNNVNLPSNMGGNGKPGASLFGWREFFPNSFIFGADIDSGILFTDNRIRTFQCDQTDVQSIFNLWSNQDLLQPFDIIIEDGLHTFEANVCFFENSIHKLKNGGNYIIEDIVDIELPLFVQKIEEWKIKYPDLLFNLIVLPVNNDKQSDNIILHIKKQ